MKHYAQPSPWLLFCKRAIGFKAFLAFLPSHGMGFAEMAGGGSFRAAKSFKRGQWTDLGKDLKPVFCSDAASGAQRWLA
jgi:hypothetical protein